MHSILMRDITIFDRNPMAFTEKICRHFISITHFIKERLRFLDRGYGNVFLLNVDERIYEGKYLFPTERLHLINCIASMHIQLTWTRVNGKCCLNRVIYQMYQFDVPWINGGTIKEIPWQNGMRWMFYVLMHRVISHSSTLVIQPKTYGLIRFPHTNHIHSSLSFNAGDSCQVIWKYLLEKHAYHSKWHFHKSVVDI